MVCRALDKGPELVRELCLLSDLRSPFPFTAERFPFGSYKVAFSHHQGG